MKSKKRVLISRAKSQATKFVKTLVELNFEVVQLPMIETAITNNPEPIHQVLNHLEVFDWLVFTSQNAVRYFFELAEEYGTKLYFYPNLKIATVGEKTKLKLEQLGYRTNFVPIKFSAEVLAENMDDLDGKKVLIPRSSLAADQYVKKMEERGAEVVALDLYHTLKVSYSLNDLKAALSPPINFLTFASPSAVEAFYENLRKHQISLQNEKLICIGPSTAEKAKKLGFSVYDVATPHSMEGMVETLKKLINE